MPARRDAEVSALPWLIVFSHLRWGFVGQRPQHLMSRLARHYRVLFVEEPVRCEGAAHFDRITEGPNVEVLCPRTPSPAAGFADEQLALVRPLLVAFLREHGIEDYLVWFYAPMALPLIDGLEPRGVVYDCMHELGACKDAPPELRQREAALLSRASLVFTDGPALYDAKRALHPRVHCLPSAVEAGRFAPASLDSHSVEARAAERLHAAIPGPRFGFFGIIDERIDLELVATLAEREPGWQIVMVGPVAMDAAALPQRPNIHWLGMQPQARLPHLLQQWDVCLMPFALDQATRCLSPTQTLESMAGEKPVVSTALYDVVALHGDVVHIGRDAAGFVQACAAALAESGHRRNQRLGEMLAIVARMSWEHSAESVHRLIAAQAASSAQIELAPSRPRHGIAIGVTPLPYRRALEGEAEVAAAR